MSDYPNIRLTAPDLPVVNVGNRANPIYLPPEVCTIIPGQASASKLSPEQTAEMIRFAVRNPSVNANYIVTEGAKTMGINPQSNLALVNPFHLGPRTSANTGVGKICAFNQSKAHHSPRSHPCRADPQV